VARTKTRYSEDVMQSVVFPVTGITLTITQWR